MSVYENQYKSSVPPYNKRQYINQSVNNLQRYAPAKYDLSPGAGGQSLTNSPKLDRDKHYNESSAQQYKLKNMHLNKANSKRILPAGNMYQNDSKLSLDHRRGNVKRSNNNNNMGQLSEIYSQ